MSNQFAMLFPGQGSQTLGMLSPWEKFSDIITPLFDIASEVLGYDIFSVIQHGPQQVLDKTEHTQPALLATEYAMWKIWQQEVGIQPTLVAGHSLGEYTALVCAGSLDFKTAIKLVALRGQAMQQAVEAEQGAMAAIIGLEDEQVAIVCASIANLGVVTPANYNSPGQVVISGDKPAVLAACDAAKSAGAKLVKVLAVSVPSHCSLMAPAAESLANAIDELEVRMPTIPVVHNADARIHESVQTIRDALVAQLTQPVLWTDSVKYMLTQTDTFVECGPGKILTGLNKRLDKTSKTTALTDLSAMQTIAEILSTVSV